MLSELERLASKRGIRLLRLETNRTLKEAIALYRGSGYVEVGAFNTEPYAHHWFEKRFKQSPGSGKGKEHRGTVTPIMKLLVVVDTLKGIFIAWSMARTFIAPAPMPSSPDIAPAPNMRTHPVGTCCTL